MVHTNHHVISVWIQYSKPFFSKLKGTLHRMNAPTYCIFCWFSARRLNLPVCVHTPECVLYIHIYIHIYMYIDCVLRVKIPPAVLTVNGWTWSFVYTFFWTFMVRTFMWTDVYTFRERSWLWCKCHSRFRMPFVFIANRLGERCYERSHDRLGERSCKRSSLFVYKHVQYGIQLYSLRSP